MELSTDRDAAQDRYALWLAWGTRLGLALVVAGFAAYALGLAPHIPIEHLPALWQRPAAELLGSTGLRPGWHWASLLHRSDMLVLAAVAFLTSCSAACLAAVLPIFHARGEAIFVAICVLQIGVLLLAASGVFSGAH